jgi:hypothetical protein
MPAVL